MSKLNSLNFRDLARSLLDTALIAIGMAFLKFLQEPGFSVFTADWGAIFNAMINAAIAAFIVRLGVSARTDSEGKINLGKMKL